MKTTKTFIEEKTSLSKKLTNGNYFIKDGDIKLACSECEKRFWVHIDIAIKEIVNHKACICSSCNTRTLIPLE